MSEQPTTITIKADQILHGYLDGHRLLESSRKLTLQAERTLLVMSDMSGPSMMTGFESYITGYPVPDLGTYAIARTWYAPEMDRPGCVWTHTILLENADLAQVLDMKSLLQLFQRPAKKKPKRENYQHKIEIPIYVSSDNNASKHVITRENLDMVTAAGIVDALYGHPNKSVYVPAQSALSHEALVLEVLNQQWPRLRRTFTFCTGSISSRSIDGKSFDLQFIPAKFVDRIVREVTDGFVVEQQFAKLSLDWIYVATQDLLAGSVRNERLPVIKDLRKFFKVFGVDATRGREVYKALTEVFSSLQERDVGPDHFGRMLEIVSRNFPEPQNAARIKVALFGDERESINLLSAPPNYPEPMRLRELVNTPHFSALDTRALNIRSRAKSLAASGAPEARRITLDIFRTELTPVGEEFLSGISEGLTVQDAFEFAKSEPELLVLFNKHNPALSVAPNIWRSSAEEQRDFFDLFTVDPDAAAKLVPGMVVAMLDASSDILADEVIRKYGYLAIATVLEWVDEHASYEKLSAEWVRALSYSPSDLLEWLEHFHGVDVCTVAWICSILNPHSPEVVNFGAKVWLSFTADIRQSLAGNELIKVMAFLLALGFNNPSGGADELVAASFSITHDAASRNELPKSSWRQLKEQAPSTSPLWSWDRCRRLRCALVDNFARQDWSASQFLESVTDKNTFRRVLECCDDTSRGRKFIRNVAEKVMRGELKATDEQRKQLS